MTCYLFLKRYEELISRFLVIYAELLKKQCHRYVESRDRKKPGAFAPGFDIYMDLDNLIDAFLIIKKDINAYTNGTAHTGRKAMKIRFLKAM